MNKVDVFYPCDRCKRWREHEVTVNEACELRRCKKCQLQTVCPPESKRLLPARQEAWK